MKEPRPPGEAEQRLKIEVGDLMVRDRALLVQRQPFVAGDAPRPGADHRQPYDDCMHGRDTLVHGCGILPSDG